MAETAGELLDLALKSKDLERKLEYCAKYLELNPNDRYVWEYKGDVLELLGRSIEGGDCVAMAFKDTSADYKAAMLTLGTEKAVGLFDAVLREEPDFAKAWVEKGRALLALQRFEEGMVCFDKALKLQKSEVSEAKAWFWKGSARAY